MLKKTSLLLQLWDIVTLKSAVTMDLYACGTGGEFALQRNWGP